MLSYFPIRYDRRVIVFVAILAVPFAMRLIADIVELFPLTPRPMFAWKGEVGRSIIPRWYPEIPHYDIRGRICYVDPILNLAVVFVADEDSRCSAKCSVGEATFWIHRWQSVDDAGVSHEEAIPVNNYLITVPRQKDAILVYSKGVLVQSAPLPENIASQLSSADDLQDRLNYLGLSVSLPVPQPVEPSAKK